MSGYLKMYKRGSWKRYWYVLKERVLYVYKASKDVAPVDQMVVLGFEVIDDIDDTKKVSLIHSSWWTFRGSGRSFGSGGSGEGW